MHIGYILAIVFALVLLGFKIAETVKAERQKRNAAKVTVQTVDVTETDVDDLIL